MNMYKMMQANGADRARLMDLVGLQGAVCRVIFCPYTGDLLDTARAVLVETPDGSGVMTGEHFDRITDGVDLPDGWTVTDGRTFSREDLVTVGYGGAA